MVIRKLLKRHNIFKFLVLATIIISVVLYSRISSSQLTNFSPKEIQLRGGRSIKEIASYPKNGSVNSNSKNHSTSQTTIVTEAKVSEAKGFTQLTKTEPTWPRIIPVERSSDVSLARKLDILNAKERIFNDGAFPKLTSDDIVIVVQVHRRIHYLRLLIDSLRSMRGIERILVIFSHDYYDEELNSAVQAIDFCKVMQIFYPYSFQLYNTTFPGHSPNDCNPKWKMEQASEASCTNAKHPDQFGHYREAAITAIKHHWWWKINTIFDRLSVTRNFTGFIILVEEDHFFSPDALVVAQHLSRFKDKQSSTIDFINLGMYTPIYPFAQNSKQVVVMDWYSAKHNMGFGMNRKTWEKLKTCKNKFCTFDDYNWDWSLCILSTQCLPEQLRVVVALSPRIFHIGSCGTHQKKGCDVYKEKRRVDALLSGSTQYLFPSEMNERIAPVPGHTNLLSKIKRLKGYGGWGDPRDHELCLNFVVN